MIVTLEVALRPSIQSNCFGVPRALRAQTRYALASFSPQDSLRALWCMDEEGGSTTDAGSPEQAVEA
jgi:hypothetical protein